DADRAVLAELHEPGFLQHGEQRAGDARPLAGGERQRLEVWRASLGRPRRQRATELVELVGPDAALLQQRLVNGAVVLVVEQDAVRLLPVAAGAPGLLHVL